MPSPPPAPQAPKNIVILGADLIGCSAAYYLSRHASLGSETTITLVEPYSVGGGSHGGEDGLERGGSGLVYAARGGEGVFAGEEADLQRLSVELHEQLAMSHNGALKWGYQSVDFYEASLDTSPSSSSSASTSASTSAASKTKNPTSNVDPIPLSSFPTLKGVRQLARSPASPQPISNTQSELDPGQETKSTPQSEPNLDSGWQGNAPWSFDPGPNPDNKTLGTAAIVDPVALTRHLCSLFLSHPRGVLRIARLESFVFQRLEEGNNHTIAKTDCAAAAGTGVPSLDDGGTRDSPRSRVKGINVTQNVTGVEEVIYLPADTIILSGGMALPGLLRKLRGDEGRYEGEAVHAGISSGGGVNEANDDNKHEAGSRLRGDGEHGMDIDGRLDTPAIERGDTEVVETRKGSGLTRSRGAGNDGDKGEKEISCDLGQGRRLHERRMEGVSLKPKERIEPVALRIRVRGGEGERGSESGVDVVCRDDGRVYISRPAPMISPAPGASSILRAEESAITIPILQLAQSLSPHFQPHPEDKPQSQFEPPVKPSHGDDALMSTETERYEYAVPSLSSGMAVFGPERGASGRLDGVYLSVADGACTTTLGPGIGHSLSNCILGQPSTT